MSKSVDYYKLLGVSIFATEYEIRTGYLKRIKHYHPDTFAGDKEEAEKVTAELNVAYSTLKDKEKKLAYDMKYGFDIMRQNVKKSNFQKQSTKQTARQNKKANKNKHSNSQTNSKKKQQNNENNSHDEEFNEDELSETLNETIDPIKRISNEQKKFRKEKFILDALIISLVVIVVLLIIFHK